MDHADKVKDIVAKSKEIFLRDSIRLLSEKPKVYNLEEEFAKTKKNKSYKLYFWVLVFINFLLFSTFVITKIIQKKSLNLQFKISEFENVKLVELLDTVKKNENKLNMLKNRLVVTKIKFQKDLENLKEKFSKRREVAYKKHFLP